MACVWSYCCEPSMGAPSTSPTRLARTLLGNYCWPSCKLCQRQEKRALIGNCAAQLGIAVYESFHDLA